MVVLRPPANAGPNIQVGIDMMSHLLQFQRNI